MKRFALLSLFFACATLAAAQVDSLILPEPNTLDLPSLVSEALERNPAIRAADQEMKAMEAAVPQSGSLDPPELSYMRDEMPGFDFNQARFSRIELMQMIRFPTKLSTERSLAEAMAEHAHHEHLEIINNVLSELSSAYFELWYLQQQMVLQGENARLMKQVAQISGTRYAAGLVPQYEVLKAQTELAMIQNAVVSLRQQERSAKEMLMAILNRGRADTLGFAIISEEISTLLPLDSLERAALRERPMLIHDSIGVETARMTLSLARQEYLPDLRIGLEYMTMPLEHMNAWSFKLGVTLPFAPWVIAGTASHSDEAEAQVAKSAAVFDATRNMVLTEVRTKYLEAESEKIQLAAYQDVLIPQSEQSLQSVLTAYENGQAQFMMVLESYRTVTSVTTEYFMSRMRFEQSVVALQRAAGVRAVSEINEYEVTP